MGGWVNTARGGARVLGGNARVVGGNARLLGEAARVGVGAVVLASVGRTGVRVARKSDRGIREVYW